MIARGHLRGRQGFTLLELLMVVIIIGILAAIALPQYLRAAERARGAEAQQILAAIRSAQLRFRDAQPVPAFAAAGNECGLDTDLPGFPCPDNPNPIPASILWGFNINAAVNATATRLAGPYAGATIQIDLNSGTLCSSNPVYHPTPLPC